MELMVALALLVVALLLCCCVAALWLLNRSPGDDAGAPRLAAPNRLLDPDKTFALNHGPDDPYITRSMLREPVISTPPAHAVLLLADGREARLAPVGEVVLGRRGEIAINDPMVGRTHARISTPPGSQEFWLQDLRSLNGTFVNGERISKPRKLDSGDRIELGNFVLTFVRDAANTSIGNTQPAPTRLAHTRSEFESRQGLT